MARTPRRLVLPIEEDDLEAREWSDAFETGTPIRHSGAYWLVTGVNTSVDVLSGTKRYFFTLLETNPPARKTAAK